MSSRPTPKAAAKNAAAKASVIVVLRRYGATQEHVISRRIGTQPWCLAALLKIMEKEGSVVNLGRRGWAASGCPTPTHSSKELIDARRRELESFKPDEELFLE